MTEDEIELMRLRARVRENEEGWHEAVQINNELLQKVAALEASLKSAKKDVAYHADCRPNRRQAEAATADAKAMNDKWADEVAARREAETALADVRARLRDLRDQWIASANKERSDTWGNTPDTPIRRAIRANRANVFDECIEEVAALLVDPLTRQEEARCATCGHPAAWHRVCVLASAHPHSLCTCALYKPEEPPCR